MKSRWNNLNNLRWNISSSSASLFPTDHSQLRHHVVGSVGHRINLPTVFDGWLCLMPGIVSFCGKLSQPRCSESVWTFLFLAFQLLKLCNHTSSESQSAQTHPLSAFTRPFCLALSRGLKMVNPSAMALTSRCWRRPVLQGCTLAKFQFGFPFENAEPCRKATRLLSKVGLL